MSTTETYRKKRADEAIKYLVEKGKINPFRLEARGYGESQLVTDCPCEGPVKSSCSEDEHQQNRRTTIKVVNCNFDVLNIGVDYTQRNDEALNGTWLSVQPLSFNTTT